MLAKLTEKSYNNANMSPQDVIIDLKGLTKRYGYGDAESYALRDFDLTVKRGEFIMIMGPSGCGKTTLLNIIGLLDEPTDGEYLLNGEAVDKVSGRKRARLRAKKIGVIFQDFNLIPRLNVLENVTLPLVYAGFSKTHREIQADRVLERFHLQEREYYMPYQLSGGQQQRVAIARSLVGEPEIILADEPTGNLDSRSSHVVMEELREIHQAGNTIIMVTHNPALTVYATRVINMLDGQIDTDIKTVEDRDLPQPVSVHFRKRQILKEMKEALSGKKEADVQEKISELEMELEAEAQAEELEKVQEEAAEEERAEISEEEFLKAVGTAAMRTDDNARNLKLKAIKKDTEKVEEKSEEELKETEEDEKAEVETEKKTAKKTSRKKSSKKSGKKNGGKK